MLVFSHITFMSAVTSSTYALLMRRTQTRHRDRESGRWVPILSFQLNLHQVKFEARGFSILSGLGNVKMIFALFQLHVRECFGNTACSQDWRVAIECVPTTTSLWRSCMIPESGPARASRDTTYSPATGTSTVNPTDTFCGAEIPLLLTAR